MQREEGRWKGVGVVWGGGWGEGMHVYVWLCSVCVGEKERSGKNTSLNYSTK